MSKTTNKTPAGVSIEEVFPQAFNSNTGIYVSSNSLHSVSGYSILPFPPPQENRNHYDSRNGVAIKYLIMHYTAGTFPSTTITFTEDKPDGRTSAHYVITEKEEHVLGGKLLQVIPDEERAWHAGVSSWKNDKNLNAPSIGIEHVNLGYIDDAGARKWFPFDPDQIQTSGIISQDIVKQYGIAPNNVLAHADIAFDRKEDPGILFPWAELYHEYQVGAWLDDDEMIPETIIKRYNPKIPPPTEINIPLFLQLLKTYGYNIPDNPSNDQDLSNLAIRAFKAHFSANQQPDSYDYDVALEDMYWAWALSSKYTDNE